MWRPKPSKAKPTTQATPAAVSAGDDDRTAQPGKGGLPLPSTDPATNFLIADILLRAAGDFARERIEKATLSQTYDRAKAEELVSSQSVVTTLALYGISRLATRSPLGLALVTGALVLKTLYDRGKSIEQRESDGVPPPRRLLSRLGKPGRTTR